jgi:small-conductance mechanosensitive channel
MATDEVPPQSLTSSTINETLQKIILSKQTLRERIAEEEKKLKKEKTEARQNAIRLKIQEITSRIQALDTDFERTVSGVDLEGFSITTENIDWNQELRELLSPILEEIKKMTARPREMEALRKQVALYQKRIILTDHAIKNMQQHLADNDSELVQKELKSLILARQQHYDELEARLAVTQQQLTEKEQSKVSVFSSITAIFQDFFKSRGLNFFLALSAFFVVFLMMREAQRLAYRRTRLGRLGEHRSFLLRLSVIIYYVLTFLFALSSFVLVLYLSGDWVLLGLSFLLLFGIFWTSKHTLSKFWEQAKLLLNISTVREGERIIYQGLPWRVMALNIYTRLHNPDLRGGMIRLPLSDLIGLESRPFYIEEPWFPTKTGDLVELSDGTIGTIALQTPEQIILDTRGGAHKTYSTLTFLGLNPINYSVNTFAVFTDFGIDYSFQSDITQTIPALLHVYITEALEKKGYGEDLVELIVEFKEAAASSLNLLIFSKFSGKQASNYFALSRFLQQAAVDACSTYGWGIPFPQVTLHHPEKKQNVLQKETGFKNHSPQQERQADPPSCS